MQTNPNSLRCTDPDCSALTEPIPAEAGPHTVGCSACSKSFLVHRGPHGLELLETIEAGSTAGSERGHR